MDPLRVGLIGCGNFARLIHAPNLMKSPKYTIRGVMDILPEPAEKLGTETQAEYTTTDVERILQDKAVDVVFITTRHDSHAELSVRAAEAGKHILCEKPMALSREECRAVAEAVRKAGVKYTVGYNRGMAPLVTRARDLLSEVTGKLMIYHRIQALFPADHWTHEPAIGGGRFVGEGCHIFDLLCELVPAAPVSVYASGGTFLDPQQVNIPDSAMITLTFADGSIGATLINSDGCATFPKEATEIYRSGKAVHIVDFRTLSWHGFGEGKDGKTEMDAVDKGQTIEIDRLADAIRNDTAPPNGPVQAARAAVISYLVNESIAGGGVPLPITEKDYTF